MSNKWQFQKKPAGEFDGFRDAGIEYFTGNPYSSLAREVIQNSLDAKNEDSHEPVRVYFDLVKVDTRSSVEKWDKKQKGLDEKLDSREASVILVKYDKKNE